MHAVQHSPLFTLPKETMHQVLDIFSNMQNIQGFKALHNLSRTCHALRDFVSHRSRLEFIDVRANMSQSRSLPFIFMHINHPSKAIQATALHQAQILSGGLSLDDLITIKVNQKTAPKELDQPIDQALAREFKKFHLRTLVYDQYINHKSEVIRNHVAQAIVSNLRFYEGMDPNDRTCSILLNHENPVIRQAAIQRLTRLIEIGGFMMDEVLKPGFITGTSPEVQTATENALIKAIDKKRYEPQQLQTPLLYNAQNQQLRNITCTALLDEIKKAPNLINTELFNQLIQSDFADVRQQAQLLAIEFIQTNTLGESTNDFINHRAADFRDIDNPDIIKAFGQVVFDRVKSKLMSLDSEAVKSLVHSPLPEMSWQAKDFVQAQEKGLS